MIISKQVKTNRNEIDLQVLNKYNFIHTTQLHVKKQPISTNLSSKYTFIKQLEMGVLFLGMKKLTILHVALYNFHKTI